MKLYNKIIKSISKALHESKLFDDNEDLFKDELTLDELNIVDNISPYNFIDLGLPSGTLWCDRNLGAKIIDTGIYYKLSDVENPISDTINENIKVPSESLLKELRKYTTCKKTMINGKNGMMFISKINNNKIFFPFTGYIWKNSYKLLHKVIIPSSEKIKVFSDDYLILCLESYCKTKNTTKYEKYLGEVKMPFRCVIENKKENYE